MPKPASANAVPLHRNGFIHRGAYAAYGGVYVGTAIAWLSLADGYRPTAWDLVARR
jgi:drug/metabolite transporter superfamily protein YnfA